MLKEFFTKSLIYRAYSVVIHYIILLVVSGDSHLAMKFTLIVEVLKIFQYALFEWIWVKKDSIPKPNRSRYLNIKL